jgi:hypothetical protein
MRRIYIASCLIVTAFVAASPATAQHKKEKHANLGVISLERPRKYEAIPVQPGEKWIRLFWKEEAPDAKDKKADRKRFLPELRMIIVPKPKKDELKKTGEKTSVQSKRVTGFDSWLRLVMRNGWVAERIGDGKKTRGYKTSEYRVTAKDSAALKGFAYVVEDDFQTVAMFGICHVDDYDDEVKLWRKGAQKLKLAEPEADEYAARKWVRYYKQKRLSHPEYRIKVREALVEPWQAEDSDNYIFVFNTPDEGLLRRVIRDIEAMRLEYINRFPPTEEVTAVSTVRICKDQAEYMSYGGMPQSAGYWNYVTEELVLYDAATQEKNKRPDDSNTFVVLYHEAFHQYIFYSTGELSPHSWFNEGYGDYFSGSNIQRGKVRKIGVNPWRAGRIQRAVERGSMNRDWVPLEKLVSYSQRQYYANGGPNYAQGWSLIYFLNTAPAVKKNEQWSAILPTYFDTLKSSYAVELEKLGKDVPPLRREPAKRKAREVALAAAFEGIDWNELQEEWLDFTEKLDVPERK